MAEVRFSTICSLSTIIATFSQISGMPPLLVAINGSPAAIASTTVFPKGSSQTDGTIATSEIHRYWGNIE